MNYRIHCIKLSFAVMSILSIYAPSTRAETVPSRVLPLNASVCNPYEDLNCLDSYLGQGFWNRLVNYYKLEIGHDSAPADPNAPSPRREDFPPAAQTIPPMPFSEWPYGGTSNLGSTRPNSIDSPLMASISNTSFGSWLSQNHLQIYGWVDVGGNISTSNVPYGNAPAAYDYDPNKVVLDQLVLYVDRFPDTVQNEHTDWGLRFSMIYGTNYRYTTSYGLASYQYLENNKPMGYDFPMLYGEMYFPQFAQGMMVRVGRYISLPDIEAQLAPNNYMYTHSMTYAFDNYTNEGIVASLALNRNWIVQGGISAGTETTIFHMNETMPIPAGASSPLYPGTTMKVDPGAQPSLTACARFNSDNGRDDMQACANGINKGQWGYNNLQWYGLTAYHQFNDKWHVSFETYYEFQNNVPNQNNPLWIGNNQGVAGTYATPFSSLLFNAPSLAQCNGYQINNTSLTCRAYAIGAVAYLNYSPDTLSNWSIRPEIYKDPQGQRTGTVATYKNMAVGYQRWFSPQIEIRPEIAYYHAITYNGVPGPFNLNPYGGNPSAQKNYQTVLSGDIIWHF